MATAAARQRELQNYKAIQEDLAQTFFTIEFDIILGCNIELNTYSED